MNVLLFENLVFVFFFIIFIIFIGIKKYGIKNFERRKMVYINIVI